MATGLVIHISSGDDKHTEVLTDERIRIGSCDDCDLRLRVSDLPKRPDGDGLVLELARSSGSYRVATFDTSLDLLHNGQSLQANAEIRDGDKLQIQTSNLALQFFPIRSLPAVVPSGSRETHVAPFIEAAAIESAATARRDDAKVFLREFTRELVREITPSTKLVTLAIALALVGGILYIGFSMFREMQRSRRLIDDQSAQLTQMKDQVAKTNQQLSDIDRSNKDILFTLSLAVKLRSQYGSGVCLIYGAYYLVETGTGRPLRYAETQTGERGDAGQSAVEQRGLTPEGKGAIAEFEFVGSGFYVGNGYVMTNRHIAQPWLADDRGQGLSIGIRGQPRLKKLLAYFPEIPQPLLLKVKLVASRDDLAVCTIDAVEIPNGIPVLPLESDPDAVAVGKSVVMMGYTSGPDRILALLDESESRGIQQRYGSLESLLGYLAQGKHIQPQTTQGSITALDVRRIAYDARTAEGGSGAPLFGPSGRVIGVNFAVFTESQASNFAVPTLYALTLLERSGWHSAPDREIQADGGTPSASAAHTSSPPPK
jgi:serine protease Do